MSDVHDMSYYGKCMVAGILACGVTHAAICPLDIVKCRKQVSFRYFVLALIFFIGKPQDVHQHLTRLQDHYG